MKQHIEQPHAQEPDAAASIRALLVKAERMACDCTDPAYHRTGDPGCMIARLLEAALPRPAPSGKALRDGDARYARGLVRSNRLGDGALDIVIDAGVLERLLWKAGLYSGPVQIEEALLASPPPVSPEHHVWCESCGIVSRLERDYMPADGVLNKHAATDLICGECRNIIATLHHLQDTAPVSPSQPQQEPECSCGTEDLHSARHGHPHLRWCAVVASDPSSSSPPRAEEGR